jgi:proteic killer suppression protein
VDIVFKTKQLQKCYEVFKIAKRQWGEVVAYSYVERINIIKAATDIAALQNMPVIRCHSLKGDRKGQWSITLTGRYRLIFILQGKQPQIVRIEEVNIHYGD